MKLTFVLLILLFKNFDVLGQNALHPKFRMQIIDHGQMDTLDLKKDSLLIQVDSLYSKLNEKLVPVREVENKFGFQGFERINFERHRFSDPIKNYLKKTELPQFDFSKNLKTHYLKKFEFNQFYELDIQEWFGNLENSVLSEIKLESYLNPNIAQGETPVNSNIKSLGLQEVSQIEEIQNVTKKLDPRSIQDTKLTNSTFLKDGQAKLKDYKAKFLKLEDSRDFKNGIKKSSLNHKNFSERIEFGVMAPVASFNPVMIKPNVGYRINKKITTGIGTSYNFSNAPNSLFPVFYGQYYFKDLLFVNAEYSWGSKGENSEDRITRNDSLLGGVGTEMNLFANIYLRSKVLYRVNEIDTTKSIGESKWQVLIGIVFLKK